MTNAQRAASAINTNKLTWDGGEVKFSGPAFLTHAPELVVPFGSGSLDGGAASFGPALTLGGVSAQAVLVVDNVAPTSDGCETITNGAALAGKIAVVDRGLCTFVLKVKAVQNAGAIGCVLINNAAGAFSPGGSDPTITIPTIAILQSDGTALKAAIAGGPTTVNMRLSPTKQAGLSANGRVLMFAPNPLQPGSSVSHWDVTATPNLLMEPAINADLNDSVDLTAALFRDIGWLPHTTSVPSGGPSARVALAGRPNPAHGGTSMHFELAADETLVLSLYDLNGRQVRSLASGAFAAGAHDVAWDGLDNAGHQAAPGIYLVRLKGARTQVTQHVVLIN
jgi:hypothetical protein